MIKSYIYLFTYVINAYYSWIIVRYMIVRYTRMYSFFLIGLFIKNCFSVNEYFNYMTNWKCLFSWCAKLKQTEVCHARSLFTNKYFRFISYSVCQPYALAQFIQTAAQQSTGGTHRAAAEMHSALVQLDFLYVAIKHANRRYHIRVTPSRLEANADATKPSSVRVMLRFEMRFFNDRCDARSTAGVITKAPAYQCQTNTFTPCCWASQSMLSRK